MPSTFPSLPSPWATAPGTAGGYLFARSWHDRINASRPAPQMEESLEPENLSRWSHPEYAANESLSGVSFARMQLKAPNFRSEALARSRQSISGSEEINRLRQAHVGSWQGTERQSPTKTVTHTDDDIKTNRRRPGEQFAACFLLSFRQYLPSPPSGCQAKRVFHPWTAANRSRAKAISTGRGSYLHMLCVGSSLDHD